MPQPVSRARRLLQTSTVAIATVAAAHAFGLAVHPLPEGRYLVPPSPRDGEGAATTVAPILIFHSIRPYAESDTAAVRRYVATPQTLEQELAYLRDNGYASITFDQLANHIAKNSPLPLKPVILSFDDDWESQYAYAFPLLKKYGFTATYLTRLGDEALRAEIFDSKRITEECVGVPVTAFAYPFGQYNQGVVAMVNDAGFTSARSTWPGAVHSQEGLFSLSGLLQSETAPSFVASMARYFEAAQQKVDGTGTLSGSVSIRS
jgi:hypothetical protein